MKSIVYRTEGESCGHAATCQRCQPLDPVLSPPLPPLRGIPPQRSRQRERGVPSSFWNSIFVLLVLCAATVMTGTLVSCGTYGITYGNGKSWPGTFSKQNQEMQGTLQLGTIDVDKPGGSYSIEREINAILPLLFWEMGYVFEPATGGADYIVDVYARERDIQNGWNTKKSISLEVVLWPVQSVRYAGDDSVRTPYAAGRTVITGTASLSVSGNMENLLRKTAKKAVKAASLVREREAYQ